MTTKKQVPVEVGLYYQPLIPSEKPYLIGSKCCSCGCVTFPKKVVCPACIRDDTMEEIPLNRRGRIYSFTVVQIAPPGFVAPYIQAVVDLAEGPRIFSLITGCEPSEESLEIGMEVELVIDKICEDEEGNELIGYKFQPVRE